MHRANWMVFLFSFLIPAATLADDASTAAAASYSSNLLPESSQAYWLDAGYASSWQLPPTNELSRYSDQATAVIADLKFRDPGAFARVSKVRELSLLTLAEAGESRLFFGVNYEGLFGFHLGARPRLGDERYVELARMPYLNSATRDNVAR
ncbi:MAG: hypothetical protein KJO09_12510 [Gammaproteobacteria bacterium]|nr:hypothetical protein [Gammaproteobacteria bacterium]